MESIRCDVAAFEFYRLGDSFKKRRGFHFDDVAAAFEVRDRDAAEFLGHERRWHIRFLFATSTVPCDMAVQH